jgi:hypothetical protein
MNMTDLRVLLFATLPVAAVIFPWFSFDDVSGLVTLQFTIDGLLMSLGAAGAAVAAIYAKWGKR